MTMQKAEKIKLRQPQSTTDAIETQTLRQVFATHMEIDMHKAKIGKAKAAVKKADAPKKESVAEHFLQNIEDGVDIYTHTDDVVVCVNTKKIEEAIEAAEAQRQKMWEQKNAEALAAGKELKPLKPLNVPVMTQNCKKVIIRCLEELAKQNTHISHKQKEDLKNLIVNPQVSFTCKDFMERCGRSDINTTSDLLADAALVMHNIGYVFTKGYIHMSDDGGEEDLAQLMMENYNPKGSSKKVKTLRPFSKTSYEDGIFSANLDVDYAKALCSCFTMYLPDLYYKINPNKNPYSMNLLFYFYSLCRQRNSLQGTTLKVRTILEKTGFNIQGAIQSRQLEQKLRNPFERDMDELSDILQWEYCGKKGSRLSQDKIESITRIEEYLDLNVKIIIKPPALPPYKNKKENK